MEYQINLFMSVLLTITITILLTHNIITKGVGGLLWLIIFIPLLFFLWITTSKVIYHKEDFRIGVEEDQLARLKKLDKTHHNLDKILVKDGIAFLPALFLSKTVATAPNSSPPCPGSIRTVKL